MAQAQGTIAPQRTSIPGAWAWIKVVLAVIAGITGLVGVGLLVAGIALVVIHGVQRDDDGFLVSPNYDLSTDTYAIVSEDIDLASRPGDWWPADPGTVRFTVDPTTSRPVFIGIAPADELSQYLDGVAVDEITELGAFWDDVKYRNVAGGSPAVAPGQLDIWVAAAQGTGVQEFEWEPDRGEWQLLVMNADGSPGLRADVEAGFKVGILLPIGIGLIVAGALALIAMAVMLVIVLRRSGQPRT